MFLDRLHDQLQAILAFKLYLLDCVVLHCGADERLLTKAGWESVCVSKWCFSDQNQESWILFGPGVVTISLKYFGGNCEREMNFVSEPSSSKGRVDRGSTVMAPSAEIREGLRHCGPLFRRLASVCAVKEPSLSLKLQSSQRERHFCIRCFQLIVEVTKSESKCLESADLFLF